MLSFALCVLICAGYTICCCIETDRIRNQLHKDYIRNTNQSLVNKLNDTDFVKEFSERIEIESDGSESAEDFVMHVLESMIRERSLKLRKARKRDKHESA